MALSAADFFRPFARPSNRSSPTEESSVASTANGILKGAVFSDLENADLLVVTGGVGKFRSETGEAQVITTDPR